MKEEGTCPMCERNSCDGSCYSGIEDDYESKNIVRSCKNCRYKSYSIRIRKNSICWFCNDHNKWKKEI